MGSAAKILSERARRAAAPANQAVMDALLEAMQEACRLANEGHTVVGMDISGGRATLQLERSRHLANLVESGAAAYTTHAIGTDGQRRRVGELLGRGRCRVTWMEVGV